MCINIILACLYNIFALMSVLFTAAPDPSPFYQLPIQWLIQESQVALSPFLA